MPGEEDDDAPTIPCIVTDPPGDDIPAVEGLAEDLQLAADLREVLACKELPPWALRVITRAVERLSPS